MQPWRGRFDTQERRQLAFPVSTLNREIFSANANMVPFTGVNVARVSLSTLTATMVVARGIADIRNYPRDTAPNCIAILNLIAPYIPDDRKLSEGVSREFILNGFLRYMSRYKESAQLVRMNEALYTEALARGPLRPYQNVLSAWDTYTIENERVNKNRFVNDHGVVTRLGVEALSAMFDFMSSVKTPFLTKYNTNLYVLMYLSLAKRGTVTANKLQKIVREIRDKHDVEMDISQEDIRAVFSATGEFITAENANEVFETFANDMQHLSLRMNITLSQVMYSGLTSLNTIATAMRLYPDFPWDRINLHHFLSKKVPHTISQILWVTEIQQIRSNQLMQKKIDNLKMCRF